MSELKLLIRPLTKKILLLVTMFFSTFSLAVADEHFAGQERNFFSMEERGTFVNVSYKKVGERTYVKFKKCVDEKASLSDAETLQTLSTKQCADMLVHPLGVELNKLHCHFQLTDHEDSWFHFFKEGSIHFVSAFLAINLIPVGELGLSWVLNLISPELGEKLGDTWGWSLFEDGEKFTFVHFFSHSIVEYLEATLIEKGLTEVVDFGLSFFGEEQETHLEDDGLISALELYEGNKVQVFRNTSDFQTYLDSLH